MDTNLPTTFAISCPKGIGQSLNLDIGDNKVVQAQSVCLGVKFSQEILNKISGKSVSTLLECSSEFSMFDVSTTILIQTFECCFPLIDVGKQLTKFVNVDGTLENKRFIIRFGLQIRIRISPLYLPLRSLSNIPIIILHASSLKLLQFPLTRASDKLSQVICPVWFLSTALNHWAVCGST